jgi:hypothetical protein
MYFNLKTGASEEEFVKKLKEYFEYLRARVDGILKIPRLSFRSLSPINQELFFTTYI